MSSSFDSLPLSSLGSWDPDECTIMVFFCTVASCGHIFMQALWVKDLFQLPIMKCMNYGAGKQLFCAAFWILRKATMKRYNDLIQVCLLRQYVFTSLFIIAYSILLQCAYISVLQSRKMWMGHGRQSFMENEADSIDHVAFSGWNLHPVKLRR